MTVSATPTATIVGESDSKNDFSKNKVVISSDGTALTIAEDVAGIAFKNINFINTASSKEAVIIRGTKNGFYSSQFISAGNVAITAKLGLAVIANSYIQASGKIISGAANLYIFNTQIVPTSDSMAIIYNQGTTSDDTLYNSTIVLDRSTVSPKAGADIANVSLAAAGGPGSVVVYRGSSLGSLIAATGVRVDDKTQDNRNFYGEYDNTGPGAFADHADTRAPYVTPLSSSRLAPFTLGAVLAEGYPDFATSDTSWIDPAVLAAIESADVLSPSTTGSSGDGSGSGSGDNNDGSSSTSGDIPTPTSGSGASTSTATSSATATWARPSSGTIPPRGAVLVSKSDTDGSYSNLTGALASLPSDDTTQVIFVSAGSYDEQVPAIDRDGPVMIIGYTEKDPGRGYTDNEVTITFSRGLSLPAQGDHTDAETATVSTASKKIAFYNINMVNTANLDGSKSSYATLAASIFGSHIAFYGCSFVGWQETLLTGGEDGYQYYESSYIEGAIDIISGPATAYFKGCTIGAQKKSSAFTAQSRPSSKTGGYVFDQCYFGPAFLAPDLTEAVYLGRPRSEYALVVVKHSYLGNVINPSGWEAWSSEDPRTDHVMFGEYKNTDPGS